MNTDGLYYLATPIKHAEPAVTQGRFIANLLAFHTLTMGGLLVYAPCVHHYQVVQKYQWPKGWDAFWKKRSLAMVDRCDAGVILLQIPGWEESEGVRSELLHASGLGRMIYCMKNPASFELELMMEGK